MHVLSLFNKQHSRVELPKKCSYCNVNVTSVSRLEIYNAVT